MRSIAFITLISAALFGFGMASPAVQRRAPAPAAGDTHITTLVCDPPAPFGTCKKDCDCPGDSAQPDCSEPVCHDNCRCREQTPPPPYPKPPTPPPPYEPPAPPAPPGPPRA